MGPQESFELESGAQSVRVIPRGWVFPGDQAIGVSDVA